jgi:capsular polysaccharide export protein
VRPEDRVILFLQGPPSTYWSELADAVAARGARVLRVSLHLGDALFWRRRGAVAYRGRFSQWRGWLDDLVAREGVTDIVYYADRLPYHRVAAQVARRRGAQAHAVEFGYLRPDWLTLEREGGGAFSHFPCDVAALPETAAPADMTVRYGHPFWREAASEVIYNLAIAAGRPAFPFYFDDKYYTPIVEYLTWLIRLARGRAEERRAAAIQAQAAEGDWPYALIALQLQSDYQLRASSPYLHQEDMLRETIGSFAAHAPRDMRLIVKQHPLDNGMERWARRVMRIAARHGIAERVLCIDGGDLGALIRHAAGVIVINSTVGLHALRAGRPVKALGAAVYDAPGLTDQGPLALFWTDPVPPDPALIARFVNAMADQIQIKGSFYNRAGRRRAAPEMAARLVEGRVGPPLLQPPPRPPRSAAIKAARHARGIAARAGRIGGGAAGTACDQSEEVGG